MCKLFSCKTHTSFVLSQRDSSGEVWNGKVKLENLSHFAGSFPQHSPLTTALKLCYCVISWEVEYDLPKVKHWSIYSVSQRWNNLQRAVNPRPDWHTPDLEPPPNTHETYCYYVSQRRSMFWSYTDPSTMYKVKSISTWPNEPWQIIDLRLSKTSILCHSGDGAQMAWLLIFWASHMEDLSFWPLIWESSSGANFKHCHNKRRHFNDDVTHLILQPNRFEAFIIMQQQ